MVYDAKTNNEKEVVAYFTLRESSIPYIDCINEDDETYDEEQCGISSIEIRMFAVSELYQDTFYNEDLIAAMIFRRIIYIIDNMSNTSLGVKAIYLHSVEEAKTCYERNGIKKMEKYIMPFHSAESEYKGMYVFIREVNMCLDE